tara:strand:+ start:65 stop:310 length:246 start_codon:yes stop_codon:yes gene_type:complete
MQKKIEKERKKVLRDEEDSSVKSDSDKHRPQQSGTKRSRIQMGSNTQERLEYHLANKNNPNYPRQVNFICIVATTSSLNDY